MSDLGSSSKQQSTAALDPDFKRAYLENLNFGKDVAGRLGVQQFAPMSGDYAAGAQYTRNVADANSAGMQNLNAGADITAQNAQTRSVDNLDAYLNPYLNVVADNTLNQMSRAQSMALDKLKGDAVGRGAFGGSRDALVQTESSRNFLDTVGSTMGNIYKTGFDTAAGLQSADLSRFLAAGQQLANLGVTQQQQGMANATALQNLGLAGEARTQRELDAARNLGLEQLAIRNQALGINPGGGSGMVSKSSGSAGSGLFGLNGK